MYINLDVEQVRRRMTNEQVANKLGITRQAYERKKKNGRFFAKECKCLCKLLEVDFDYLFANE